LRAADAGVLMSVTREKVMFNDERL
jgi:hypothetical protein